MPRSRLRQFDLDDCRRVFNFDVDIRCSREKNVRVDEHDFRVPHGRTELVEPLSETDHRLKNVRVNRTVETSRQDPFRYHVRETSATARPVREELIVDQVRFDNRTRDA